MGFNFTPPPEDFDLEEFMRRLRDVKWDLRPSNPCVLVRAQRVDLSATWADFISQMAMDGIADEPTDDEGA